MERSSPKDIIMPKVEESALEFLREGREWDEPHTRAVVYYAGVLAKAGDQDGLVITTAAWFHDVGYSGLFEGDDSKDLDTVWSKKERHMIVGAKRAEKFLQKPEIKPFYRSEQAKRIVHLVSVHDKVGQLTDDDEIILMEADTLAAIDVARVTPTFDYNAGMRYIEKSLKEKRIPRFRENGLGKELLDQLLPQLIAYFECLRDN